MEYRARRGARRARSPLPRARVCLRAASGNHAHSSKRWRRAPGCPPFASRSARGRRLRQFVLRVCRIRRHEPRERFPRVLVRHAPVGARWLAEWRCPVAAPLTRSSRAHHVHVCLRRLRWLLSQRCVPIFRRRHTHPPDARRRPVQIFTSSTSSRRSGARSQPPAGCRVRATARLASFITTACISSEGTMAHAI